MLQFSVQTRKLCTTSSRHAGAFTHAVSSRGDDPPSQDTSAEELASILGKSRKDHNKMQVLHLYSHIQRHGLVTDASLGNLLVSALADVGCMCIAQQVFDTLACADDSAWNSMITGYVRQGNFSSAFTVYQKMKQNDALHPSGCSFVGLLKACSVLKDVDKGSKLHAEVAKRGLLESNMYIGSALIDMYGKCGFLERAQEVFDTLATRDVVCWTALIRGYSGHGRGEEALAYYEQMPYDGISLNAVTFICILKACAYVRSLIKSRQIHGEIVIRGYETDLLVGSTLVDTYAKCALLKDAQRVFDKLPSQGVFSWTALIAGYTEQGHAEEAIFCMRKMRTQGISPNAVTLMCSLKACGSIGAAHTGQNLHVEVATKGYESELLVCSTLVDLYAKCGLLGEARYILDRLSVRDVISWNALMGGYALLGESENVFSAFERMQGEGMKPNVATLSSILTGCSHAGLVDKGYYCFDAIYCVFGMVPTIDHYTCMVDLLGRAGLVDTALAMVEKMPLLPGPVTWRSMMGACRKWGNLGVGRHAFEHVVLLNATGPSAYVSMSNLYVEGEEEG